MCTAAMGLIGPVLNAGLSIAQANVQKQAIYERAAEQQRQYEANKTLALRAYDMQQEQIDKQTVEQVRETQMAAFDQTLQARDVMGQTRALNASVGRTGQSVDDTYGAISQVSNRNLGRLAHRRSMLIDYGQDLKKQSKFDAEARIASVQQGRVSQAELAAANLTALGGVINAFGSFTKTLQSNQMISAQMNYQQQSFNQTQQFNQNMMNMYDARYSYAMGSMMNG
jgi:hypothetical protein